MDRSFLSHEDVIAASRDFVCIRCATYEDEEEAKFLRWIFTGRSGDLENTVFCILSPDASKKLIRGNRGPMQFRGPQQMAAQMKEIAADYPGDHNVAALPQVKNVRLGINVAACDSLPAVVILGENDQQLAQLKETLAPVAWDKDLLGMYIYCQSSDADERSILTSLKGSAGFAIVKPDDFGQEAEVIAEIGPGASAAELKDALLKAARKFKRPNKSHHQHVRSGRRDGVEWETEIPVTDAQALRAQRNRRDR